MSDWRSFLKDQIPQQLPGESSHEELSPLRGLSSEELKKAKNPRKSAVAIHLILDKQNLEILLTQRNIYDGAHSGQISFPGGKKDATDPDLIYTARRESFEEVAMPYDKGELIGSMTEIYIPVSNFHVFPYVFFHQEFSVDLIPDPREVSNIFRLPHSALLDEKLRASVDISISKTRTLQQVPCFKFQDYIIWGATAIMLNELKQILLRKS